MDILIARKIFKRFGNITALDGLTASFRKGISALIGPNGAGKTTFINICAGLIDRDSGDIKILGLDPWDQGHILRRKVEVLLENVRFPNNIPAYKLLYYKSRIYGINSYRERIKQVASFFEIDHFLDRPLKQFSAGMYRRFTLTYTLLNPDIELLILDEPASNLDVAGRIKLFEYLDRIYRELDISIVLSSHILPDLLDICQYYFFIKDGKIVWSGDINRLYERLEIRSILIRSSNDHLLSKNFSEYGIENSITNRGLIIKADKFDIRKGLEVLLKVVEEHGIDIYEFRRFPDPLTQFFKEMSYGE